MLGDTLTQMPSDMQSKPLSLELELDNRNSIYRHQGITALTVDIPDSYRPLPQATALAPPRWRTPEFIFYAAMFCIAIPIMIWIPISLSSPLHPNYPLFRRRLSPGWLFGRRVDNSDAQYRSFRNGIPSLTLLATVFLGLKFIYSRAAKRTASHIDNSLYLVPFLFTFSAIMLIILHGTSVLKVFTIISINYAIVKTCGGSKLGPIVTWIYNAAILFANEWYSGYKFASIHPSMAYLDSMSGVYPGWHVTFNITMLRLVSFNMDYHWAYNKNGPTDTGSTLKEKQRARTAHTLPTYSYANYIAYILYPPLYIAGPIITFNDFIWQLRRPTQLPLRSTLMYLLRFLICILTMEFTLHFMYVVAIKDTKAWVGYSAAELSVVGLWNLFIVWLKLLVPWRFFRLWALADGIDPPENMVRCVYNNYSIFGFWRSWHRSFNLWIVRYIYIPLGGTGNVICTTILVFTFVALWHDLSFRLLAWGWLASLFFMPELAAQHLLPSSKYGNRSWYRHSCAVGAVFNLYMLMIANLIGFVVGTDGISFLLQQLIGGWDGIRFLIISCICLFIAAQVMMEYREEEMRRGIYRRC